MAGHPTFPDPDDHGSAPPDHTVRTPGVTVSDTSPLPPPGGAPPLPEAAFRLLREHGTDMPRLRRVLALLADGRWWSADDLVRGTGVAYTLVSSLLTALDEAGELAAESAGRQSRVRLARPSGYAGAACDDLADPVAHLLPRYARAHAELARAVAEGPASDLDLDHVTATADTALRRALFLATRFDLHDRVLLCVGDHDLTSIALTLVCPGARAEVVDIDERVLAHIDALADRLDLRVRTHTADLRLGLPSTVRGVADVVFTDPPYTADGVELFVRRGVEGMADPRRGRVLVAYGASETTPKLAAATQSRLARMDLLFEAVWPDFNRYHGAESIGAASDLYVLRPLTRAPAPPSGDAARVYSQGVNAKEARGGLDAERARAVLDRVRDDLGSGGGARTAEGPEPTLVGAWPSEASAAGRVRLSTWMEAPAPVGDCAVLNLTGGWERLAARAALASAADTVYALVPSSAACVRDAAGQRGLRALVEPRFDVRFLRGFGADDLTAVRLTRRPPAVDEPGADARDGAGADDEEDRGGAPGGGRAHGDPKAAVDLLLIHVQERAHGTLTATLRGGLVEVSARMGRPANKRTARQAVSTAPWWLAGHTLLDLPEHRFAELRGVAAALLAQV
ncbi:bis-aminopropyl spermidine synthase family protein [Nocardiopsis sp. NPDC101807]|uniref:bis-aminopropyl spermidine synthase family protein n=1 Tax=Nocardiopsis sp. NPDC101807 TaxID=3364339 RepID=UPI00382D93A8